MKFPEYSVQEQRNVKCGLAGIYDMGQIPDGEVLPLLHFTTLLLQASPETLREFLKNAQH